MTAIEPNLERETEYINEILRLQAEQRLHELNLQLIETKMNIAKTTLLGKTPSDGNAIPPPACIKQLL